MSIWLLLAMFAQSGGAEPVRVSAAISLTEALEAVAVAYRTAGGGPVSYNFAGSNALARQIVSGAPVDVFVSADDAQMNVVERAGLLADGTRVPVVGNQLVVVVGDRLHGLSTVQALAAADVRRIAIGDPAAVPAGVYARQYLQRVGLWERLAPKLVPTTNVRAALTAVQNGSADAAIVYATDARIAPAVRVAVVVSGPESPRIAYPAAVIRTSGQAAAAARFVGFLRTPAAQRIFESHGFVPLTVRR